jgi:serine/threonine-protein kinase
MKTCPVCDTPYPNQHNTCPTDGAVLIESGELATGHIVRGKYRIVRKLGQGGMGIVYLAEHLLLGGQLALKFLAIELSKNPQFVKRFRNEARAAYQLRHPNIVEVADLDQDEDGSLFIAMEYVAGPSLRTALRDTKEPIPVQRALQIAQGVAAGLAAAHSRGAVHRDIKPENILLCVDFLGDDQPKVLDFGIAAMTENITNLSRTHGLLLTPEYAAPEQWRGTPASELDGRTDLYALGGVLYEMLAGRTPFHAVNPEGWMFQHLQGVPDPLVLLRPDLARDYPGLDAIVMRLLARERERRFDSAAALLEALASKPPSPGAVPVQPAIERSRPREATPIAPERQVLDPGSEVISVVGFDKIASRVLGLGPNTAGDSESGERELFSQYQPRRRSNAARWFLIGSTVIVASLGIWLGLKTNEGLPLTAIPVLAPAAGTYEGPQAIAISDTTPGATIHYTLDGSLPTNSSPVYSLPLSHLKSGTRVRAIATADGHKPSAEVAGVYVWSGVLQPPANPQRAGTFDQAKSAYEHKWYAQARALFAQICDDGDLRACNYLGYLYAQGLGGRLDREMARTIYQKACDRGTPSSCASLGSLYQDAGNDDDARKYFTKACDGGLKDGCTLLQNLQ